MVAQPFFFDGANDSVISDKPALTNISKIHLRVLGISYRRSDNHFLKSKRVFTGNPAAVCGLPNHPLSEMMGTGFRLAPTGQCFDIGTSTCRPCSSTTHLYRWDPHRCCLPQPAAQLFINGNLVRNGLTSLGFRFFNWLARQEKSPLARPLRRGAR